MSEFPGTDRGANPDSRPQGSCGPHTLRSTHAVVHAASQDPL